MLRGPHWPRDRFLELLPRDWPATRARLDTAELERELGTLATPSARRSSPLRVDQIGVNEETVAFHRGPGGVAPSATNDHRRRRVVVQRAIQIDRIIDIHDPTVVATRISAEVIVPKQDNVQQLHRISWRRVIWSNCRTVIGASLQRDCAE